nr:MAG TPA: integrase serine recombinase [Caudoviricetes sp.]
MECVAYMRVSTEKQAEDGNGLESQKRDIDNYCNKNGYIISDYYIDDGYTGANMDRPELQRLISDCVAKRIKCVVAFKLDRLSRSMVDGIYIIERVFQANNILFKCVHDSISYDSPMEQAYTQMMAVFAQLDKNTMMLRMRGGMLERVKQGYWMGGGNTPYCYKYDKEKGILVPIPERKEQANQALDLFIDGYSDVAIKKMLNFTHEHTVKMVLTSPVNIGMIPYKGNLYKGLHEPIFDKDRFQLAQEARKNRRKKKTVSLNKEPNLLTGLCYCGVCGCKMRYQKWGSESDAPKKIYCCSRNKDLFYLPNYNKDCDNSIEWATDIEKQVEAEIIKISLNLSSQKPIAKQSKIDIIQSQIKKEKYRRNRLFNLYADGNDDVLDMIKQSDNTISSLKEQLETELSSKEANKKKSIAYENIKKIADVWDSIDKRNKNMILKTIIDKIIIVNGDIEIQLKNF